MPRKDPEARKAYNRSAKRRAAAKAYRSSSEFKKRANARWRAAYADGKYRKSKYASRLKYWRNKAKQLQRQRDRYKTEAYRAKGRERYKLNQKRRQWFRDYIRKRRAQDSNFSIALSLRRRLHHVLRGERKTGPTLTLIGCSLDQLRAHLQSQFQPGMAWNNYGQKGWHIDHIRPCASFDLTDPEQQRQCFDYTNLQPLWEHENCSKGAQWESATP